eukprot:TRINITY_DN25541_c0_g1_i1.p1 TRINITY_DN25541_c0_g1~~TRINITY_DN25541_c0_g1_i1.p1  ORF type:complete len:592 (+),score=122.96 TRINITY_DN25541_c0_g1_i1:479-2254(+)
MLRNSFRSRDFNGVLTSFSSMDSSTLPAAAWSVAIEACCELNAIDRATNLLDSMVAAGRTENAVAFNAVLKMHLRGSAFEKAMEILQQMENAGCAPNNFTFNELVACSGHSHKATDRARIWELIDKVLSIGGKPSRGGCAQLLKNLPASTSSSDLNRAMELIDNLKEHMDEGLLACSVECCIRLGRKLALAKRLELLNGANPMKINGAHTYGTLIKGYSCLNDVEGAWRCWKTMVSDDISPTSITIGCMVEAIASNGDVDGAHELIRGLLRGKEKNQINSIIYGSILKGYSRAGRMEDLWKSFQEMRHHNVEPSQMTFNTLIDACARNKQMEHLPALTMQMTVLGLKPNVITLSTMIKGFCAVGNMKSAFALVDQMRKGQDKPDEVVYNTMIDGCFQAGLVEDGERLVIHMQAEGVAPSNYTLTVLVRLLGKAGKIDRAIEMVEQASKDHRIKLNSHVHSALVQACISAKDFSYGARCYWKASCERSSVEGAQCRELIRGLLKDGKKSQAVKALLNMLGLDETQRKGCGSPAVLHADNFVTEVIEAFLNGANKGNESISRNEVQKLVEQIKTLKPKLAVQPSLMRKVHPWN